MQSRSVTGRGVRRLLPVDLALPEHLLLEHPLLLGTNQAKLAPVLARVPIQRAAKGAVLNHPGTSGGKVHLVLLGRLKAYHVTADGDELLLELIDAGGLDGLLPAFGRHGHFTEAVEDSLVASIPRGTLESLMMADSRVASNLIRIMFARLARRESHLGTLALEDPVQRLANLLLSLAEADGVRDGSLVSMRRLSRQMIACMLGLRPFEVGLRLRQLVDLEAITLKEDRYLLDVEALRRVIDRPSPGPRSD